jgi:hypothetical protein
MCWNIYVITFGDFSEWRAAAGMILRFRRLHSGQGDRETTARAHAQPTRSADPEKDVYIDISLNSKKTTKLPNPNPEKV